MDERERDKIMAEFQIGHAAKRTNTTPQTIRYYERIGLLPEPARASNGYRIYTSEDIERLRFIRRAKLLGLTLDEIKGLLEPARQGACSSLQERLAMLLDEKIAECDRKIAELRRFREDLSARRQHVSFDGQCDCTCDPYVPSCNCMPVESEEITGQS